MQVVALSTKLEQRQNNAALSQVESTYSFWGRHPSLYAAQDLVTFLGRHRYIRGEAAAAMNVGPGANVLEIACGSGRNFPYIHNQIGQSGRLVGVDLSGEMLAAARGLCKQSGWQNIELFQGDAAELDIPYSDFDGSLSVLGISAIPAYKRAIARAHSLLRPGGILAVCDARLFQGHLRALNPLVERIYGKFAAWDPTKQVPIAMKEAFGNVAVRQFNFGSFYIAVSRKE